MAVDEAEIAARLIEQLLADPAFRDRFRRDPVRTCREAGLDAIAADLSGRRRQGDAHARPARVALQPGRRDDGGRHGGHRRLRVLQARGAAHRRPAARRSGTCSAASTCRRCPGAASWPARRRRARRCLPEEPEAPAAIFFERRRRGGQRRPHRPRRRPSRAAGVAAGRAVRSPLAPELARAAGKGGEEPLAPELAKAAGKGGADGRRRRSGRPRTAPARTARPPAVAARSSRTGRRPAARGATACPRARSS